MRILSRQDIESISRTILRKYLNLENNQGKVFDRIEPETLARQLYGIEFEFRYLSRQGAILGITSFDEVGIDVWDKNWEPELFFLDRSTALIDIALQDEAQCGRRNFTMMHETAHLIFQILFPEDYGMRYRRPPLRYHLSTDGYGGKITDWEEWQANTLASYLLLPRELVLRTMIGAGFSSGIKLLNRKFARKDFDRFEEMSLQLGVSKQALAIRMKQLGLLERNQLKDPNELINIYVEDHEWQMLQM